LGEVDRFYVRTDDGGQLKYGEMAARLHWSSGVGRIDVDEATQKKLRRIP